MYILAVYIYIYLNIHIHWIIYKKDRELEFSSKRLSTLKNQLPQLIKNILSKLSLIGINIEYKINLQFSLNEYKIKVSDFVTKRNTKKNATDKDVTYKKLFQLARNWFDQNKYKIISSEYWVVLFKEISKQINEILLINYNNNDNILNDIKIYILASVIRYTYIYKYSI